MERSVPPNMREIGRIGTDGRLELFSAGVVLDGDPSCVGARIWDGRHPVVNPGHVSSSQTFSISKVSCIDCSTDGYWKPLVDQSNERSTT
jgi:hypothetical protein